MQAKRFLGTVLLKIGLIIFTRVVTITEAEVTLTPSTQNIAENNPLALTCSYTGSLTVSGYIMIVLRSSSEIPVQEGSLPADCNVFAMPPDTTLYEYRCPTNSQLSWTIKNVTRTNAGDIWTCMLGFTTPGYSEEANLTIHVQVPIQNVVMSSPTNNVVTIQENRETEFVCKTSGGLPAATVRWFKDQSTTTTTDDVEITNFATTTSSTIDDLISVTSTLKYSPGKGDNGMKIYCTARNSVNTSTSDRKPQLNVQYSPNGPPTIQNFNNGATCKVIENIQRVLSCSITGGNPLATLLWTCFNSGSASTTVGSTVSKTVTFTASRGQDRSCICQSSHPVAGTQSVTVNVQILYPPKIQSLNKTDIVAGSQLSVSCPYEKGNPQETTFKWTRSGDRREWNDQILLIENVTKHDDMMYNCTVTNKMKPTGAPEETGQDSKSFHLNVLYQSTISSFVVDGILNTSSVIVNENDNLQFVCIIDSNPNASVEIAFEDKVIYRQNNSNSVHYSYKAASCLDAGVYTCTARNRYYLGISSVAKMKLFVKCPPRPLHQIKVNFTSSLNNRVTLNLTTLAYPEPGIDGFAWYKQNSFTWVKLLSNVDLIIASSGLQTSLTIKRVYASDFGHYRVTVTNDIGSYDQYLYLAKERHQPIVNTKTCPDNTSPTISIILGSLLAAVTVYAVSITAYLKRNYKLKEKKLTTSDKLTKTTTYENLGYQPQDPVETYPRSLMDGTDTSGQENDDPSEQYTDLVHNTSNDQKTYDVIQKV